MAETSWFEFDRGSPESVHRPGRPAIRPQPRRRPVMRTILRRFTPAIRSTSSFSVFENVLFPDFPDDFAPSGTAGPRVFRRRRRYPPPSPRPGPLTAHPMMATVMDLSTSVKRLFRRFHDGNHARLEPAAGRAGNDGQAPFPEAESFQNLPPRANLVGRVRGQRDPDGVPYSLSQKRADADGGTQAARTGRARLGDAEMNGVFAGFGKQTVGVDGHGNVRGLDRDDEVPEFHIFRR